MRGPVSYDLVSLLKDCYVVWPRQQLLAWLDRYREKARSRGHQRSARAATNSLRWFDRMGLQRHLKVLGIFARLWHRDGKSGYLGDLPRVLDYTLQVTVDAAGARRIRRIPAAPGRAGILRRLAPRGPCALKSMILAAGRGERMRPLTEKLPKPMLEVGGHRLIEYHLAALVNLGVRDVVINLSWHGDRIREALGDGSVARPHDPLQRGGARAARHRRRHCSLRCRSSAMRHSSSSNGDVWSDFALQALRPPHGFARAPRPGRKPGAPSGRRLRRSTPGGRATAGPERLTFSGISVLDPRLFDGCEHGSLRAEAVARDGACRGPAHRAAPRAAPGGMSARRQGSRRSMLISASARRGIPSSRRRSAKMAVSPSRDATQVADLKGIPIAGRAATREQRRKIRHAAGLHGDPRRHQESRPAACPSRRARSRAGCGRRSRRGRALTSRCGRPCASTG